MIDVSAKTIRLRSATARGRLLFSAATLERVQHNTLPKGDLFATARAAGLLATKRTPDLVPHCHLVSVDHVAIEFKTDRTADGGEIVVDVLVRSIGRTGPEIEAIMAVMVTLGVAYDLLKPIDKEMRITDVSLLQKTGGKSDPRLRLREGTTAAVLASGAAVLAGHKEPVAASLVAERLRAAGVLVEEAGTAGPNELVGRLNDLASQGADLVFTVGGIGPTQADFVAACLRQHGREVPAIGERMRAHGADRTPLALFTSPLAVVWQSSLVVALPGSSSGALESMDAILPGVFQAARMIGKKDAQT